MDYWMETVKEEGAWELRGRVRREVSPQSDLCGERPCRIRLGWIREAIQA
jgi:hypothetical protein